jgi:hypothetical protein
MKEERQFSIVNICVEVRNNVIILKTSQLYPTKAVPSYNDGYLRKDSCIGWLLLSLNSASSPRTSLLAC